MEDNTQVNDDEKKLKFAKLSMPASIVDFLIDHYGFFDLVEVNQLSLLILNTLGHIEKDGFKFALYRKVDDKVESYQLDINDLIAKFRIQLAQSMVENKQKGESDEKNSV